MQQTVTENGPRVAALMQQYLDAQTARHEALLALPHVKGSVPIPCDDLAALYLILQLGGMFSTDYVPRELRINLVEYIWSNMDPAQQAFCKAVTDAHAAHIAAFLTARELDAGGVQA